MLWLGRIIATGVLQLFTEMCPGPLSSSGIDLAVASLPTADTRARHGLASHGDERLNAVTAVQLVTRGTELIPFEPPEKCTPPDDIHHGTFCLQRGKTRLRRGYYVSCGRLTGAGIYTVNMGMGVRLYGECPVDTKCSAHTVRKGRIWMPKHDWPRPEIVCEPEPTRRRWRRRPRPAEADSLPSSSTPARPSRHRSPEDAPQAKRTKIRHSNADNALVWHDDSNFGDFWTTLTDNAWHSMV